MIVQATFLTMAFANQKLSFLAGSSVLGILAMVTFALTLYALGGSLGPAYTIKIEVGPAMYLFVVLLSNVAFIAMQLD